MKLGRIVPSSANYEELADQVWKAWSAAQIDGVNTFLAWLFITNSNKAG